MQISTKGKYAVRAMLDIAQKDVGAFEPGRRAFRQQHHIHSVHFVTRCHNDAAYKIQIEPFRWYELEEAEGLLGQPPH